MLDSSLAAVLQALTSWPVLTFALALTFRKEISELLPKVVLLRIWRFEARLENAISDSIHLLNTCVGDRAQALAAQRPMIEFVAQLYEGRSDDRLRERPRKLAREFEQIRGDQASGRRRTDQLERMAARMRVESFTVHDRVQTFRDSASFGEQMVALAALQVRANASCWDWLLSMTTNGPAFLRYHALLALQTAFRTLEWQERHLERFRQLAPTFLAMSETRDRRRLYLRLYREVLGSDPEANAPFLRNSVDQRVA